MTVLATISVLLGISFVLPDTTPDIVPTDSKPEKTAPPASLPTTSEKKPTFSSSCYDVITVREKGRVYIFQSKQPLQEGVNPMIFPDLPSYRVWTERSLGDGVKCPVLFYDPADEPYVHPEEKYAGSSSDDISRVRSSKRTQQTTFPEATWEVHDDSTMMGTRDTKSSYIRSATMEPSRYVAVDGVVDNVSPASPPYAEACGHVEREMHDNLIIRSRKDATDTGADEQLPIPPKNTLRDVPQREISLLAEKMEEKDPSMKGAVLRRTGYSKYEVDEILPENKRNVIDSGVKGTFGMGQSDGLDIDLLAYGGTVVPVTSINRLFG